LKFLYLFVIHIFLLQPITMSKGGVPSFTQDWQTVTINKRPQKATGTKEQQANKVRQQGGEVLSEKRFAAGNNTNKPIQMNTRKLDEDMETLKHKTVGTDVRRALMQGRQAKGMNQKELAQAINEKPQVVTEYESGKAIPQDKVLAKMERALGIKLRGKDIGTPLALH